MTVQTVKTIENDWLTDVVFCLFIDRNLLVFPIRVAFFKPVGKPIIFNLLVNFTRFGMYQRWIHKSVTDWEISKESTVTFWT
ncbi:hypothetical protein DJ77_00245 [Halorubrum ezzemoulense]|nr:hypothetical protein DJ77_00245 [Halorubrum ezzemoulense]